MSRLKIPRPSKFVLLRTPSGELFVVLRQYRDELCLKDPYYKRDVIVAESDETLSLMRFKALTEED